ncbi:hypothetical protein ACLOJK_037608 [Asimina triloba]
MEVISNSVWAKVIPQPQLRQHWTEYAGGSGTRGKIEASFTRGLEKQRSGGAGSSVRMSVRCVGQASVVQHYKSTTSSSCCGRRRPRTNSCVRNLSRPSTGAKD